MKTRIRTVSWLLAVALLTIPALGHSASKSYSSGGGHSYSSSSSHSSSSGGSHSFSSGSPGFSSGGASTHSPGGSPAHSSSSSGGSGTKTFSSGGGKSYGSGSSWSDEGRHSYTAGKSYASGSGHTFTSSSGGAKALTEPAAPRKSTPDSSSSQLSFDRAAARAKKQEASKAEFSKFKESQVPPVASASPASPSYQVKPPPIATSSGGYSKPPVYIPDSTTLSTRPVRIYNVYNSYSARPIVTYRDPYNSFFWWWLLDRSLDDRAYWAYHHRNDMDPARYQALVASDQQLATRVSQLETQQVSRDPNFVPAGLDHDLMYSDRYVTHTYSNRPTTSGAIAFWVLAVPTALGVCAFFIWLVWFKRWQTAT